MTVRRRVAGLVALALCCGCGRLPDGVEAPETTTATPTMQASTASPSNPPSPSARPAGTPKTTPTPMPTPTTARPTTTTPTARTKPPSLTGDRRNAWAFAPLDDPDDLTVEGSTSSDEAFSTSKVLVVAAFLRKNADGDPRRVSSSNQELITAALTRSDGDAVLALQQQVPDVSRMMTRILRETGDDTTTAPSRLLGLMPWSAREQVRFMLALTQGRVVSERTSAYLLDQMHPIAAHSWGLGRIGATSYKGGWLRQGRVTRQFGVVDGYAVAIITDAVGPVEVQTDGDAAHVRQLNRLADRLAQRLAYERAQR